MWRKHKLCCYGLVSVAIIGNSGHKVRVTRSASKQKKKVTVMVPLAKSGLIQRMDRQIKAPREVQINQKIYYNDFILKWFYNTAALINTKQPNCSRRDAVTVQRQRSCFGQPLIWSVLTVTLMALIRAELLFWNTGFSSLFDKPNQFVPLRSHLSPSPAWVYNVPGLQHFAWFKALKRDSMLSLRLAHFVFHYIISRLRKLIHF